MAIFECRECGSNISTKCKSCPKCGFPYLVRCPECDSIVNETDEECFECGFPLNKKNEKIKDYTQHFGNIKKLIGIVFAIIFIVFVIMMNTYSEEKSSYNQNMYDYSVYDYNSEYEHVASVLRIYGVTVENNGSYSVATGKIKNNGLDTYYFVQVKGSFKNSSGATVDTDSTYAVGNEGLSAGEESTFRLSVPNNYSIKTCEVTLLSYR